MPKTEHRNEEEILLTRLAGILNVLVVRRHSRLSMLASALLPTLVLLLLLLALVPRV